jgi:hypothetical protein
MFYHHRVSLDDGVEHFRESFVVREQFEEDE